MKKRLFEIFLFSIILFFCLDRVSLIEKVYGFETSDRAVSLFYYMDRNTVDAVYIGDSHVYCGINPQLIFDECGVSSICLATGNQNIENSYWMLKELLKSQKPKIVFLECHSIEASIRKDLSETITHGLLYMPDFSINKYLGYRDASILIDQSPYDDIRINDIIGLYEFNGNFSRPNANFNDLINYVIDPSSVIKTFGFIPTNSCTSIECLNEGEYVDSFDFDDQFNYDYLVDIYELCQENDIKLILFRLPYNSSDANKTCYEEIFKWAANNNVDVYDYFARFQDIELNLETDFRDNTHLNYKGAIKVSKDMSYVLSSVYELESHNNDAKYILWQKHEFDYSAYEN